MCLGLHTRFSTDEVHEMDQIEKSKDCIDKLKDNFKTRRRYFNNGLSYRFAVIDKVVDLINHDEESDFSKKPLEIRDCRIVKN